MTKDKAIELREELNLKGKTIEVEKLKYRVDSVELDLIKDTSKYDLKLYVTEMDNDDKPKGYIHKTQLHYSIIKKHIEK